MTLHGSSQFVRDFLLLRYTYVGKKKTRLYESATALGGSFNFYRDASGEKRMLRFGLFQEAGPFLIKTPSLREGNEEKRRQKKTKQNKRGG